MENQIGVNDLAIGIIIGIHIFISILSLIIANNYEKSIITERSNKYIFLGFSLFYSLIVPHITTSALLYAHWNGFLSAGYFRFFNWSLVIMFVLFQILVYKILNNFESKD